MKTKLLNQEGVEVWTVDLNKDVFWIEINSWLIHRALIYQLSNSRKVLAHTKTRWERRWSTRKIYRQKWTWRARMWSNRSPIRKKWWVVFWPRNNINFSISMNKKERKIALFSLLSTKYNEWKIIVVDNIDLKEIKTKNMAMVLSKLPYEKNVSMAIDWKEDILFKSSSNIPNIKSIDVNYLNIKDLLKYNNLLLLKNSLDKLNSLK